MKNLNLFVLERDYEYSVSGGLILIVPTVSVIFLLRVSAAYGNKRQCELAIMIFIDVFELTCI